MSTLNHETTQSRNPHSAMTADPALVHDFCSRLMIPDCVYEVRIPNSRRGPMRFFGTVSGYFDNPGDIAGAVQRITGADAEAVYVTLNPVTPDLLARASNRLVSKAKATTGDGDIGWRGSLLIDVDPVRPSGISATDEERDAALDRRDAIRAYLSDHHGWGAPLVVTMSGNGGGLIYPIEAPNDAPTRDLIDAVLTSLAHLFDDHAVTVDTTVSNAARITKIPGTVAAKGDDTERRPWRQSTAAFPGDAETISRDQLQSVADIAPENVQPRTGPRFNGTGERDWTIEDVLRENQLPVNPKPWQGGTTYALDRCLTSADHTDGACIVEMPSGALVYRCHHNRCQGKDWKYLREHDLIRIPASTPTPTGIPYAQNGSRDMPPAGGSGPETHEPRVFANTDTGNSERLVALHGSKIRFNWGRNVWHVWSDKHWEEDRAGRMDQLAKLTARSIPDEAMHLTGEAYTRMLKWAAASESSGKRQATIDLARSEDGIPVQPHELDADPWLLNVANGTLDLRDGTLRPHHCEDLITRLIDVPYDPDATCPLFLDFLNRVFDRDEDLISYVQRIVGYSLTGSIREQMVVIAFGPGSNGKSTLIGILRRLLGDYAREADADSFMERKTEAIREDIAALDGARFVSAAETGDGKRLSEALIKKMTGGERLRARRLYENGYEFMPQFKVWLSTNHRPEIHGTEHAIWRRIRLLPFSVTIPDNERDLDLPEKLATELPGILTWAVRGCTDWQRLGESPPAIVLQATNEYRRDMDLIGNWLEDRCELRRGIRETPKALYEDYVTYCDVAGDTPLKQRTFAGKLSDRGCGEEKSNNIRYRTGIRLRDPNRPDQTTFDAQGTQGTQGTRVSGKSLENSVTRDLPESNVPCVPHVPDDSQAPLPASR